MTLEEVKAFIDNASADILMTLEQHIDERYDDLSDEEEKEAWQNDLITPVCDYLGNGQTVSFSLKNINTGELNSEIQIIDLTYDNKENFFNSEAVNLITLQYTV